MGRDGRRPAPPRWSRSTSRCSGRRCLRRARDTGRPATRSSCRPSRSTWCGSRGLRERGHAALAAGAPARGERPAPGRRWPCGAARRWPIPRSRSRRIEARAARELHLAVDRGQDRRRPGAGAWTPSLIGELEALVARHPLRERTRGQLMVALYRGGPAGRRARGLPPGSGDARRRARHRALADATRAGAPDPAARSGPGRARVGLSRPRVRTAARARPPSWQGAVRWSSPCPAPSPAQPATADRRMKETKTCTSTIWPSAPSLWDIPASA